ncbi:MAG: amidase [Desulfomonile tiedjei]|uniref:Amidase n=1 Tax=Desulfomonile tiedjei TaxID=2358 RepID=A0A9D6Z2Q3_9BACT|nr:amidase [Desulfomonile tiedjei]
MTGSQTACSIEKSRAFVKTFPIEPIDSGLLDGLAFAVKDLIDVSGQKTGCGNPDWSETHPEAVANAVCVDQLLASGARCVGKTITDELAFGLDGENFFWGTPLNPRAGDRVPGGSSSGSASAVACGIVDFALGTDTGGSVRVPASNCGIYGFRPTHGFVSVAGVNPLAPSFDTVGILAADPDILTKAASILLGTRGVEQIELGKVHVLREAFETSDPAVREALAEPVKLIRDLSSSRAAEISLKDIDIDCSRDGLRGWYETYCLVQWAEIWSCLGSWVDDVKPQFGPKVTVNFQLVKTLDRKTIPEAVRRRESYFRALKNFLGPNDLICIPTAPTPAPKKGSLGVDRTVDTYFQRTLSLTAIAGIGRLPQVTLPLALVDGVPIGISLLAAQGMDSFLLSAARMLAAKA